VTLNGTCGFVFHAYLECFSLFMFPICSLRAGGMLHFQVAVVKTPLKYILPACFARKKELLAERVQV